MWCAAGHECGATSTGGDSEMAAEASPNAARSTNEIVDVLIIGAGASGAAVAWSLAETRMKILCLEQGDWIKSTEFPSNGRDWEARRYADFDISPNRRARDTRGARGSQAAQDQDWYHVRDRAAAGDGSKSRLIGISNATVRTETPPDLGAFLFQVTGKKVAVEGLIRESPCLLLSSCEKS